MSIACNAVSHRVAPVLLVLLLASCATIPSGPSIMALPGSGKSFDEFRADDASCQQYATEQIKTTPNRASIRSGVGTAALGTAVGAAAGALMGGASGATIGAGSGLLGGTLIGSGTARGSGAWSSSATTAVTPSACMLKAIAFQFPARSWITG